MTPSLVAVFLSALTLVTPMEARDRSRDRTREEKPSRYAILEAERSLETADLEHLERLGARLISSLGSRRYIVRIVGRDEEIAADPSVREIVEIDPTRKMAGLRRSETSLRPFVFARVQFQEDVSFEEASAILGRLGSSLHRPLQIRFELPRVLTAWVPGSRLEELAGIDEVLTITAGRRKLKSMNANAALLSAITPIQAPPYSLDGSGVTVSLYDLGNADSTHPEFGGRLTNRLTGGNLPHPTHVAGTLGASGVDPSAKGMAPAATLLHFEVDLDFVDRKNADFAAFPIAADNNSYGFVYGWNLESPGWVWYENDIEFGGYDVYSAGIDRLIRDRNVILFFAAGNDNADSGPFSPPFLHSHLDLTTEELDPRRYCYSPSGSGNDCPVAPDPQNCQVCETVRHPPDGPFRSIGSTSAAKNAVAVGSLTSSKTSASSSSRGPARDGRVKPDLVAKGDGLRSTAIGGGYTNMGGTSMATPVVTGAATLLTQQWRSTVGAGNVPHAVLKTLLVAGAEDLGTTGPDYTFGFGLVNAQSSVDLLRADAGTGSRIARTLLRQSERIEIPLTLPALANLRVVLGWSDPENPATPLFSPFSPALVNDLDLMLVGPADTTTLPWALNPFTPESAAIRTVNRRDNTEVIDLPGAAAGNYKVVVTGTSVPAGPQDFVVVANAALGPAAIGCSDSFEPNSSAESAFGRLRSGLTLTARLCDTADVDFYRFTVDRSGPVEARVTAGDTPLRLTLSAPGFSSSIDVAARATQTLQTFVGSGVVPFTIKVEPLGAVVGDNQYTLRPSFGTSASSRRRAVR